MGTWKNYINKLESEFVGKKVTYNDNIYTIVKVDYNGIIHINKPTQHNTTTAVFNPYEAREHLIKEV